MTLLFPRLAVAALILLGVVFSRAEAFLEYTGPSSSLDLRGFLDLSAADASNPDLPLLYKNRNDLTYGVSARLLASGNAGSFSFEFNGLLYDSWGTADLPVAVSDVERSGALEWKLNDGTTQRSHILIDHMNIRFTTENTDLIVGRQAINLATCFFFTPNDLFAPFSAQTFYRVYKPGVDAARLEVKLGELTQLSFIEALGYSPSMAGPNGWSGGPEGRRSTAVAYLTVPFAGMQWGLLGGKMRDIPILGGSLQGELFKWLGIRAEGHVESSSPGQYTEVAGGVEHRFENGLTVRYEQFHHGSGYGSPSQYLAGMRGGPFPQYFGMNYGALGFDYQFSPLLTGDLISLMNFTDSSNLVGLYAAYSLSNESEVDVGLFFPFGTKSGALSISSEYGLYPVSATIDLRMFF